MIIPPLLLRGCRYLAALFIPLAVGLCLVPMAHAENEAKETLRPEFGKPLQAAQELMKTKKYAEALAKVREADAIPGKTPYESFILERMRGAAAAGAGDADTAGKAFEAVINSGRLPAAENLKLIEAMAGTHYRAREYPKAVAWAQRYLKEGGGNDQIRTLLVQAQFLGGDYGGAAKELTKEFTADEQAGRVPSEDRLQLLANCNLKVNDYAAYARTLEWLVSHYPKKEYWADLISRIQRRPGFSERLALDVYRLQMATGNLHEAGEYLEMTQLAIQAGLPAEAKKVVNEAFAKDILGKGSDAERHKRLRDLANKQAADDLKQLSQGEAQANAAANGNVLVSLGYAYVTNGQFDKGIALMEKGIAKGGLKRPEDAQLHLGLAYLLGSQKAKALQILKSVNGQDGLSDLARLWAIQARHSS